MKRIELSKIKPNFQFKKISFPNIRDFRKDALLAVLSYIHILAIVPLLFGRRNEFVHYHAKQGFFLLIIWVLAGFALYLPFLPWVFFVLIFVDILFGLIHVALGKTRPMPLMGKLAERMSV